MRVLGVIVLSDTVYAEIAEVLARPRFARVLTLDRRRETLELLAAAALWIEPKEIVDDCRDAKDNCYLELALAGHATLIVSGDEDLLVLDPGVASGCCDSLVSWRSSGWSGRRL